MEMSGFGGIDMRIYRQNTFFIEKNGYLIKKYKMNTSTHLHTHDFIEIVYTLSGQGIHTIDDKNYSITRGSFFVVDSGRKHKLVFYNNAEYYNLFLTETFLRQFSLPGMNGDKNAYDLIKNEEGNLTVAYFDQEKALHIERIFNSINLEFSSKKYLSEEFILTYMQLLFFEFDRARIETKDQNRVHKPHIALPRIIDYINEHLNEKITIESLAQKYNYNPAYFGRMFKNNYHVSINAYITQKRIEYACELLETTNYNINFICSLTGFTNKLHFYKEFKKVHNCTPKEYRKKVTIKDNIMAVVNESDTE